MRCPQCGFTDENVVKPLSHAMNVYVKEDGKVDGIYNADAPTITFKGVTLTRQDLWKPKVVTSPPATPTK